MSDVGNLLLVRWLDAHNYPVSWQLVDEIEPYVAEVSSVGWEIHRDERQLILSADVADDIDGQTQVNSYFAIPRGCIISEEILKASHG